MVDVEKEALLIFIVPVNSMERFSATVCCLT